MALLPSSQSVLPRDLREELDRRGFEVHESIDAYEAMARLVVIERSRRSSPDAHAGVVLLAVEPDAIAHGPELRASANRFVPGLVCWRYASSATPRLARWEDAERETGEPTAEPAPARVSKPTLRLTEISAGPDPLDAPIADTKREASPEEAPGVLSEEELAMLLGESEVAP